MLAKESKWRNLNVDPLASLESPTEDSEEEENVDGEGLEVSSWTPPETSINSMQG